MATTLKPFSNMHCVVGEVTSVIKSQTFRFLIGLLINWVHCLISEVSINGSKPFDVQTENK